MHDTDSDNERFTLTLKKKVWLMRSKTEEKKKRLEVKPKIENQTTQFHRNSYFAVWGFVTFCLTLGLFSLSMYQSVDAMVAQPVCPQHTLHLWKTASVYSGWYYTHTHTHTHNTENKQSAKSQHFYIQSLVLFLTWTWEYNWVKCDARLVCFLCPHKASQWKSL